MSLLCRKSKFIIPLTSINLTRSQRTVRITKGINLITSIGFKSFLGTL